MNVLLRDFQEQATVDFVRKIRRASRDAAEGELQAVSLSSPTGSGKTVMAISIIERILAGDYEEDPQSGAVFLWLTDLPELNIQTRDRMISMSTVLGPQSLVTIDNSFDAEELAPGKVYFLNTQKLGKSSMLIQRSDLREHGLWETISNTVRNKPGSFYLIVDEAHRGMNQTAQARNEASSIVQKFIFGSEGETPPVPLVLGISATPQRFNTLLAGAGGTAVQRTHRPVIVNPADVRASGLIKEVVRFVHPNESQPSDVTLLREAVKSWNDYRIRWETYCSKNNEDKVSPLLVVQVRDGSDTMITATDIDEVMRVITEESGLSDERAFAHAFQDKGAIQANGMTIRHLAPSEISQDPTAQVVFFKTSLNTGWDCPRAEVMMSFRSANDATHIAQLVGRMVRTPLTRRIELDERLNSVALFLPHYDAGGLREVVSRLTAPDSESAIASDVVTVEVLSCAKVEGSESAFQVLSGLPSYSIPRSPQPNETRRLMKLARALARDGILDNAPEVAAARIHEVIDEALEKERDTVRFKELVEERDTLDIMVIDQLLGNSELAEGSAEAVRTSPENIADLFESAGRKLGDGLHKEWWRRRVAANTKPYAAKLEFIALAGPDLKRGADLAAKSMSREWMKKFSKAIHELGESRIQIYEEIMGLASEPELSQLRFPDVLEVPKSGASLDKHIYQDDSTSFYAELNDWEKEVVSKELADPEVAYWIRNVPRKPWALSVPYSGDAGHFRALYPDFIFLRDIGSGKLVADIVDPHNPNLGDSASKMRGLAEYAGLHGESFGRIEAVIVEGGSLIRVNLKDDELRNAASKVVTSADVEGVFHSFGTSKRG